MLSTLHWLPVRYRIDLRFFYLFLSLNGLPPEYLSDLIQLHQPSRALRSASQVVLDVPRSFLKSRGDRAFQVAAPTLWNALPLSLRTANSLSSLKTLLKTHLFTLAFGTLAFFFCIAGCWFCMDFIYLLSLDMTILCFTCFYLFLLFLLL